jgi:hypothetical protein
MAAMVVVEIAGNGGVAESSENPGDSRMLTDA